jgi:pimeloyl-ACP methyl ester carboxylesterase
VDELDARPITLTFEDPWAGQTRTGLATGDTLIMGVFNALYRTEGIGSLPGRIAAIADGDHGLLREELGLEANAFGSEGAFFRVVCQDDFVWTDPARIRDAAAAMDAPRIGTPFTFWAVSNLAMCAAFGAGRGDPPERDPVVSDIPTLILSGAYDPITPPRWGTSVAGNLARATQVVVPGVGHGVLGSSTCVDRIANGFLDNPPATVNPACALALPSPIFRN